MSDTTEETRSAPTLTYSQSKQRIEEILVRMEEIQDYDEPTNEDDAELVRLAAEFEELDKHRRRLERQDLIAQVNAAASDLKDQRTSRPNLRMRIEAGSSQGSRSDYDRDAILEPDSIEECRFRNPWDLSEMRTYGRAPDEVAGELRARALSAIEKMQGCSDNVREAATQIIEKFDDERGTIAQQCLATSSPAYLRAWSKLARNHGSSLTDEEKRAVDEVRAMSLTDSAGGYLVPFQLDPTVIITSDGSRNDIRRFARQVVATGDVWHGVSAGAVQWSFAPEASEASDNAPTFAQPKVEVRKAQGFVPISIEAFEDAANVTAEVAKLLAFGKDELEAKVFIDGDATSNQPIGLITALDNAAATTKVDPAATETFAVGDVYKVQGSLPARYRANASWLANNLTYNTIRNFDSAGGSALWERIGADRPPLLLGRPAGEAEEMRSTVDIDPAKTEDNYILVFGDFQHYVIADRIGMTVEFIPHLFGATNRFPTGQRGWYAYYRVGADVVNPGAFRVLNVATTA